MLCFGKNLINTNQRRVDGMYALLGLKYFEGKYQCYIMDLYWYTELEQFRDNRRQNVFDTYDVYNYNKEKLRTDRLCNRTDQVVAWKRCPKPYCTNFKKIRKVISSILKK